MEESHITDNRKQKLIDLGPDILAEALIEISQVYLESENVKTAYPYGVRYLKKLDKRSEFVTDGKNYNTKHYNLSAIIAVGYKVSSERKFYQKITDLYATSIDYD